MSAGGKKRPRADLLSSLDAIFSSVTQPKASKYTALASSQSTSKGIVQQAYQHSKRKRVNKKRQLGSTTQESTNEANKKEENNEKQPKKNDLLYEKLDLDLLAIGLKDCSLSQIKSFSKPHAYHETLKSYLEAVTKGSKASSTAVDSLKNKVLSLDNPFKNTAADTTKKAIARASLKQTHKLISARQRRKLGLHVLGKEMSYRHAEQLHRIWTRYVSQVIESDIATVQPVVEEEQRRRNAKLQTKFKYLDLSGCRAEVELKDFVKCSIDGLESELDS
ncbi:uncharacterized protein CCR75_000600 [Bremia lactucae]|uniref:Uncharacterized protein n=1 Tax=Bremia lactucae TaxID=4779 RepID=A0A976FE25_BRELC|nr:hypothetical protein CCR75_000600 [Bremia lactucae]